MSSRSFYAKSSYYAISINCFGVKSYFFTAALNALGYLHLADCESFHFRPATKWMREQSI